jgi:hypothetical protein
MKKQKQKPASISATANEEQAGVVLPDSPKVSINQVSPWITRVMHVDTEVIKNLETKLDTKYGYNLLFYLQENGKLWAQLAATKVTSRDTSHLDLQNAVL